MSLLLLARHGNTFEAGQPTTWVGAKTDLLLTVKGLAQADALAARIADHYQPIGSLIAGPLQRTRQTAARIAERLKTVFTVDERLTEIDYGLWENKTSAEIRAAYGDAGLDAWEKEGVWPDGMRWAPSQEKLLVNIHAFLDEQHRSCHQKTETNRVAVTSNGLLRFVYRLLTDELPGPCAKVKTGHYCALQATANGWEIVRWNEAP